MDQDVETFDASAVDFIELTADIVSAYVSKNSVRPSDMPELLASIHSALTGLNQGSAPEAQTVGKPTPSQIRKSITPDALISFIDGKPYKTLKRHLTGNGMTIEQYRERFGLPRDYPSTAASYSEKRSALAKSLGLGNNRRKAAPKAAEPAETVSEKPKRAAGRPRKAKAGVGLRRERKSGSYLGLETAQVQGLDRRR
ncbi:MucR family transcriptional regulator [Methylobacterium sp. E-066]|uniref:MucR family transcriptional regulator n=1 Tax=Methylobacterium sp. E-066 TaxID=2836584 RepID=UPI001FB87EDC|nr:MucR family transcriptional regulator [Methylobacterium sp. E-066]MCJ2140444.1 MucR family transcriptional regulator [Methylobacterium sp. E-066]